MSNQRLYDTASIVASRDEVRIATLISSLTRSIATLNSDIEHEEKQAQVFDVLDPLYPMLARALRTRRDNVAATVAALEALANVAGDHSEREAA